MINYLLSSTDVYFSDKTVGYCSNKYEITATALLMQRDERRAESVFVLEVFLLCLPGCEEDGAVDLVTVLSAGGHRFSVFCTAVC